MYGGEEERGRGLGVEEKNKETKKTHQKNYMKYNSNNLRIPARHLRVRVYAPVCAPAPAAAPCPCLLAPPLPPSLPLNVPRELDGEDGLVNVGD